MSCYSYFRCGHLYLRYKSTYSITTSALIQIPFSDFSLSTKKKFHRYLHIFSLYCFCFFLAPVSVHHSATLLHSGAERGQPNNSRPNSGNSTAVHCDIRQCHQEQAKPGKAIIYIYMTKSSSKHVLFCSTVL